MNREWLTERLRARSPQPDGDAPCVVLMVGARNAGPELIYPADPVAAKHAASVEEDTEDPREAYSGWTRPTLRRFPWPPS